MPRHSHLRDDRAHANHSVSPLELFFDLVFVFAVTQMSHYLLAHHTIVGALQTLVMFMAVWWAWIYTAWATNWLDPAVAPVRMALMTIMALSMVMSSAIPEAFGPYGLAFAIAYVTIQVGRTAYTAWAREGIFHGTSTNMARATLYFIASGIFWIAGGLQSDPTARLGLWVAALAIESAGPLTFFYVPGIGRSTLAEWNISGAHMAERCGHSSSSRSARASSSPGQPSPSSSPARRPSWHFSAPSSAPLPCGGSTSTSGRSAAAK
jgi:low temperature requirement protein LtrA